MATENAQKKQPETTESYRGEIRNVERVMMPANDNRRGRTAANDNRPTAKPPAMRPNIMPRPISTFPLNSGVIGTAGATAQKGVAVARATSATWTIIVISGMVYPIQLAAGVVAIAGLAALMALEETWLGYLDFFGWFSEMGREVFFVATGLNLIIGILTLLGAALLFVFRGVNMNRGLSLVIAALCLALYAVPGINLLPWAWAWCFYVVKSQID